MPRTFGSTSLLLAPVAALLLCTPAFGQWLGAPEGDAPRLANGEVDLEAPPPRSFAGSSSLTLAPGPKGRCACSQTQSVRCSVA